MTSAVDPLLTNWTKPAYERGSYTAVYPPFLERFVHRHVHGIPSSALHSRCGVAMNLPEFHAQPSGVGVVGGVTMNLPEFHARPGMVVEVGWRGILLNDTQQPHSHSLGCPADIAFLCYCHNLPFQSYNPIIRHHQYWNFRDPTTAWKPVGEAEWRMAVGCSAHMCVLRSKDFVTWRDGGTMYACCVHASTLFLVDSMILQGSQARQYIVDDFYTIAICILFCHTQVPSCW